jgi:hypothetical protein
VQFGLFLPQKNPKTDAVVFFLCPVDVVDEKVEELNYPPEPEVELKYQEEEDAEAFEEEQPFAEEEKVHPEPAVAQPKPANSEEVASFVRKYIEENHLTKASRLFGDKENALAHAASQNHPRIITTMFDLKKLIKSLAPAPL